MKYVALLILAVTAISVVSSQEEEFLVENCVDIRKPSDVCFGVKCNKKSTAIELIRCPQERECAADSEEVVLRPLNGSKPFPDCCPWTLCKFLRK